MWKRREKQLYLSFVLLILLSAGAVCIVPVFADSKPKLYVDPSSIIDKTLTPPKTFTIDVIVANITGLYGFEFKLGYDTNILDIVNVDIKPFLNEPTMTVTNSVRESEGWYWLAITSYFPAVPKNGTGTLVTLTFEVTGTGHCTLNLYEVKLSNIDAEWIDHDIENGYFNNRPSPEPALIFVDPPRIINLTLVPCENFVINVSIINAIYLYSFEFKLSFDPDMLNATSAALGNIFPPVIPTIEINNTVGYVKFSASLAPLQPEISGNGTLATITFHVEGLGSCELNLSETAIADSVEQPLPHSTSDGYFNNILLAKLRVDPPEIIDPSLMPPATFDINVTLAEIENLYGYEFNLSFSPEVLTCLMVTIHDVLNETNYIPELAVNNPSGFAWVKVTYYPPAEPITSNTSVTLVTIKFRVRAMGVTPLDLHGTNLIDSLGQPIPHESFDGYVLILIRDVAVTNVVASTTETYQGRPVYINVTVKNEGNLTETFDVSAYYDDVLIGTLPVANLVPGETRVLTFTWDTEDVDPCYNYTIKAEASEVPFETDKADNLRIDGKVKIKMVGDLNGDDTVDIFDVTIAAVAFGSRLGDFNWDERADFRPEYGVIDIFDLVVIASQFGKSC